MFKKSIATAMVVIAIFTTTVLTPVMAAPGNNLSIIPIIVNGYKVKFPDTEPYINTDGRTMVPVRFVSEKLGAEVEWEAATQTAIIKFGGKTIRMPIGSRTVTVDGVVQELDTAAEFTDGRTMVPLRFVSEVLDSKVEWDADAHAVRVTDAGYQAKIDAGEVELDQWGREYSKNLDEYWYKLSDLELEGFYDFYGPRGHKRYIDAVPSTIFHRHANIWGKKIRSYYEVQLNVDYRTIDVNVFKKALNENFSEMSSYDRYLMNNQVEGYVEWVKKNKVIAKGYADPELSSSFRSGSLLWIPTRFKFMIISAEDTSQTFLDNWETVASDPFPLKKGVWYDGYSLVSMDTIVANSTYGEYFGIRHYENIFYRAFHFYNVNE